MKKYWKNKKESVKLGGVKKPQGLFRSQGVRGVYVKGHKKRIEYRVWVTTFTDGVTEQEVIGKLDDLLAQFPTYAPLEKEGVELNEPIPPSEFNSRDNFGQWYGIVFFKGGDVKYGRVLL